MAIKTRGLLAGFVTFVFVLTILGGANIGAQPDFTPTPPPADDGLRGIQFPVTPSPSASPTADHTPTPEIETSGGALLRSEPIDAPFTLISPALNGLQTDPDALTFTWTPINGKAQWYRVRIETPKGRWLMTRTFKDVDAICDDSLCSVTFADAKAVLKDNKRYKWQVIAKKQGRKAQIKTNKQGFVFRPSTQVTPAASLKPLFTYDFDDGGYHLWMHNSRWLPGYGDRSQAIETRGHEQALQVIHDPIHDLELRVKFQIYDGAAKFYVRDSVAGRYSVVYDYFGTMSLYRNEILLASTVIEPHSYHWHNLHFSIIGEALSVRLNEDLILSATDATPLPAGSIAVIADFASATSPDRILRVDQVQLRTPSGVLPSSTLPELGLRSIGIPDVTTETLDAPEVTRHSLNERTLFAEYQLEQTVAASTDLAGPQQEPNQCHDVVIDQAGFDPDYIPIRDMVVFSDWEGGLPGDNFREEIRIKLADSDQYGPGTGVTSGAGFKLIGKQDSRERFPALSPDGTRLAFVSGPNEYSHIYVVDLTAEEWCARQLTTAPGTHNLRPAWSPDGTLIAFVRDTGSGPFKIYIMDAFYGENEADSFRGTFRTLTEGNTNNEAAPAWSPDGRFIAYEYQTPGTHPPGFLTSKIYKANVYGPKSTANTETELVDGETRGVHEPSFSPDGQYIAYVAATADGTNEPPTDVYLQRIDKRSIILVDVRQRPIVDAGQQVILTSDVSRPRKVFHDSPGWAPDMEHIVFRSNVEEGNLVFKIHDRQITVYGNLIIVRDYNTLTQRPFTAHGFWIDSAPNWSQAGVCEGNRREGLNAGTDGQNKLLQKSCLLDYRGMAFAAMYHETSEDSFRALQQWPDEFGFEPIEHITQYYMFSRIGVNGVLANVDALNVDGGVDPLVLGEDYFRGTFGSAIQSKNFEWLCGGCKPVPSPDRPDEIFPDWLNIQIDLAYKDYLRGNNMYKIYVGRAYHSFLPFYYMAVHDVVYRNPFEPRPDTNESTDPLGRIYLAKTVQLNPDGGPTTQSISYDLTCEQFNNRYVEHIVDFNARGYIPDDGPSRHLQVIRYEYATRDNGKTVNYYDVFADDPGNLENNKAYMLYGTASEPLIIGTNLFLGNGRKSVQKYTWKTWSFQTPAIWKIGANPDVDPNDEYRDPFSLESPVSRWAGEVFGTSAIYQGEPQSVTCPP